MVWGLLAELVALTLVVICRFCCGFFGYHKKDLSLPAIRAAISSSTASSSERPTGSFSLVSFSVPPRCIHAFRPNRY